MFDHGDMNLYSARDDGGGKDPPSLDTRRARRIAYFLHAARAAKRTFRDCKESDFTGVNTSNPATIPTRHTRIREIRTRTIRSALKHWN